MKQVAEINGLQSAEARAMYELLRLHILALNDKDHNYGLKVMELPLGPGMRILIEVDLEPCQKSSKPV